MANELRLSITLAYQKENASVQKNKNPLVTVNGKIFAHGVQEIGTTEEELTLIDGMSTLGYVLLHNLDDTNFVDVGSVTNQRGIKLLPGEVALFRTNGAGIFAKADTAACDVEYIILED